MKTEVFYTRPAMPYKDAVETFLNRQRQQQRQRSFDPPPSDDQSIGTVTISNVTKKVRTFVSSHLTFLILPL